MEKFIVEQSPPLKGTVKINGSKNSVLPILAATLLTPELCVVRDVPMLSDVAVMAEILNHLGAGTDWDKKNRCMEVNCAKIKNKAAPYPLMSKMRASFLIAGPLLARLGKVKVSLPGGCAIGSRPVQLHLKGFSALGAKITQEHGFVTASARKLKGTKIYLDFPSVGATENIMMAAVLAEGQTILENCAVEPEIVDLASFLNAMGSDVRGAGTDTIRIHGVSELKGCDHTVIPDRIEAGTFMIAAVVTKGDVILENVVWDHLKPIVAKLQETGAQVESTDNGLHVKMSGKRPLLGVDIKTLPYPGFPTDMQAPFTTLLAMAKGSSVVTETIFENRFMHVGELKRMGADIKIESHSAIIEGVERLTGCLVRATDLRAGAALMLAGLCAEGTTEIGDIYHIDRGYDGLLDKLLSLGAPITRKKL